VRTLRANFVSTQLVSFKDEMVYNQRQKINEYKFKKVSYYSQLFNYQTPTSSVLVLRALIVSNPFIEDISFKAREDLDCWLRVHKEIGFSYKILSPLIGYRVVDGQISGDKLDMLLKTLYCYRKTKGIRVRLFGIIPLLATFTHVIKSLLNRILKLSV
jgi:teichuronic acid biosynthesis glycosyltransferase TuaG